MPGQWGQPSGPAGAWQVMQVPVTNALATASLACGISATVFALLGYVLPTTGMLVAQTVLATLTVIMGLVGMRKGRLTGLKFGQALGGTILGAFSIVLFCVLATSQVGSMGALLAGAGDDAVATAIDDPDGTEDGSDDDAAVVDPAETDKVRQILAEGIWQGYILSDEGDSAFAVELSTDQDAFSWLDESFGLNGGTGRAQGGVTMLFGDDAIDRATAEGYDLSLFGGEREMREMQPYGQVPVFMELDPSASDSPLVPAGTKTGWFGYMAVLDDGDGSEVAYLCIARKTDAEPHLFAQGS